MTAAGAGILSRVCLSPSAVGRRLAGCRQVDWIGLLEDLMGSNIVSATTWVEIPRDGYVQKLSQLIRNENKT